MLNIAAIILIVLVFILYVYNFMKQFKINMVERLSFTVEQPRKMPRVKRGANYHIENAYTLLEEDKNNRIEDIKILYVQRNNRESVKFVIFMNAFFFSPSHLDNKKIKIIFDDMSSKHILDRILDILPPILKGQYYDFEYIGDLSDIDKIDIMNSVDNRILFPCFLNEEDTPKIKLLQQMNIRVFDYINKIDDMSKIIYTFPISYIETTHMINIFPKKKELNYIHKFLSFDNIVFVTKKDDLFTDHDALHFLQQYYFKLSNDTKFDDALLNFYDMAGYNVFRKKETENFIEYGNDKKIELDVPNHIELNLESFIKPFPFKYFSFQGNKIGDVEIQIGDTLKLQGQKHRVENDTYKIVKIVHENMFISSFRNRTFIKNGMDITWNDKQDREDKDIEIINIDFRKKTKTLKIKDTHPDYDKNLLEIDFPVFLKGSVNMIGKITKILPHYFEALVYKIEDVGKLKNMYECYGYDKIKTKEACENENSYEMQIENDLKRKKDTETGYIRGVWDRRCIYDLECPFFEKNNKGYRGGCNNGYCEMPLGVKRKSYQKYDINETSFPFCQECPTSKKDNMMDCCENKNKLGDKYVFKV